MRGARMLNSVSRSLSDVGRKPSHVGAFRRRPLSVPAITRTRASKAGGTEETEGTDQHGETEKQRRTGLNAPHAAIGGRAIRRPGGTQANTNPTLVFRP